LADDICSLGVFELARMYRRGETSPVEVVKAHLERCDRLNPVLNAYRLLLPDSAMQAARAMENLFRAGVDLGPLQGVPVSVKDLIRVRGTLTSAGSRVLLQELPDQEDARVVRWLRAAGAVIIGKTNLHEFATGDPDPAGPFGLVQNPRRMGSHPGSSSSGAGAAAAAGLGVVAIGTDTGGSIRIPAYLCGVAGLKPTTGKMDMEGIIPLSPTLDTVGPLARRVSDIAAFHALWAASQKEVPDFPGSLAASIRGWRVGVPAGEYFHQLHSPVAEAYEHTLGILQDLGCRLVEFEPRGIEGMNELCTLIIQAEASAYHERYRDREHLYGANFRERIFPGREIKAITYLAARRRQQELQEEWLKLAEGFDLLVTPAGPVVAPPHGVSTIDMGGSPVPFRTLLSRFTRPFNLLGWPALSIPNGMTEEGLPTGIQVSGPPESETDLLILGHQLERVLSLVEKLGIEPRFPTPIERKES
jgi:aspartyl-tRNA(Asn)/glutamyl-tRNA(Gln) amidotransferase subunit A